MNKELASVCRSESARHVLELWHVERLRPFETALGEHLERRFNAIMVFQTADGDEDQSGARYHRHSTYDETFIICQGHYDFRLGEKG